VKVAYFLTFVLWGVQPLFIFAPVYLRDLGIGGEEIGIVSSLLYITPLLFSAPIGFLTDIFPIRYLLLAGFFSYTIFPIFLAFSSGFVPIFVGYLFGALAVTVLGVSADSFFFKKTEEEFRVKSFSYYIFFGGIGMGIGYILIGQIFDLFPLSKALLIIAFFIFIMSPFTLFIKVRKPPALQETRGSLMDDLSYKPFLAVLIVVFLHATHLGAETTTLSIFYLKTAGLDYGQSGIVMGMGLFVLGLAGYSARYTLGKAGGWRGFLILGLILSGAGNIFLIVSREFAAILIFRLIHEVGDAYILVGTRLAIAGFFDRKRIGGIWGTVRTASAISSTIFALLSGIMLEHMGITFPLFITGGLTLIAPLFLRRPRRPRSKSLKA